jgi:hypothetical protein
LGLLAADLFAYRGEPGADRVDEMVGRFNQYAVAAGDHQAEHDAGHSGGHRSHAAAAVEAQHDQHADEYHTEESQAHAPLDRHRVGVPDLIGRRNTGVFGC